MSFFDTQLGQENSCKLGQALSWTTLSMLKRDEKSQEDFVVRGILDGYFLSMIRLLHSDHKTDRYDYASQLIERYRGQLELYAEALSRSYQIDTIEKHLILLGKDTEKQSRLTNLIRNYCF